jgi:hypothetical protein
MFSDPLSITIGSDPGTISLVKTNSGNSLSEFSNYDEGVSAKVSHRYAKGYAERLFRVDRRVMGTVETGTGIKVPQLYSTWVAVRVPQFYLGDDADLTLTQQKELVLGTMGSLTASTNENLIKLLGGES